MTALRACSDIMGLPMSVHYTCFTYLHSLYCIFRKQSVMCEFVLFLKNVLLLFSVKLLILVGNLIFFLTQLDKNAFVPKANEVWPPWRPHRRLLWWRWKVSDQGGCFVQCKSLKEKMCMCKERHYWCGLPTTFVMWRSRKEIHSFLCGNDFCVRNFHLLWNDFERRCCIVASLV